MMANQDSFQVGDKVRVKCIAEPDTEGTVDHVTPRTLRIATAHGTFPLYTFRDGQWFDGRYPATITKIV